MAFALCAALKMPGDFCEGEKAGAKRSGEEPPLMDSTGGKPHCLPSKGPWSKPTIFNNLETLP